MAEQKIEETKPAVPRRVARPFIGPAGAGGGTRPLLRPSAPTDRPRPAAFGPPAAPSQVGRQPALGAAPPAAESVPTAAEVERIATAVAEPVFAVTLPESSTRPTETSTPVEPMRLDAYAPETVEPYVHESVEAPSSDASQAVGAAESPVPDGASHTHVPARPVTSEMMAIDAFDAFEAVWGGTDAGTASAAEVIGSPLDEVSLGGGLDGPHMWTEDITIAPEQLIPDSTDAAQLAAPRSDQEAPAAASEPEMPAWLMDDAEPIAAVPMETELSVAGVGETAVQATSEPLGAIASPATDVSALDAAAIDSTPQDVVEDSNWPDPLLAEYAPYIPTPANLSAILPAVDEVPGEPPAVSVVVALEAEKEQLAEMSSPPATAPAMEVDLEAATIADAMAVVSVEAPADAATRVSATLERLADRIRSGEIDVSSVAAEAPDAAILASVLAALLGGSSSSR